MLNNGEKCRIISYCSFLGILSLFLSIQIAAAPSPSFDCAQARTKIEKLICNSEPLAKLDRIAASEYKVFRSKLPPEKRATATSVQRIWVENRGKGCGNRNLEDCVKEDYYHWLNSISKGALMSRYRELKPNVEYISPFDRSIRFKLEITENGSGEKMNGEINRNHRLVLATGSTIHEGDNYVVGSSRSINVVTQLVFILSESGVEHISLQKINEEYGGRCGAFSNHSLDFRDPKAPQTEIASITLYEEDSACDTYEKQLFRWDVAENGNPVFYELEFNSFYYQVPFVEIKAKEIDSPSAKLNEYYYVDKSKDAFLGVSYEKIMDQVQKRIHVDKSHPNETATCQIPGYGLNDYLRLKEILSGYHMGFHQIEFFSSNYLKAEHLSAALRYKPLLEAALNYLEKSRTVEDWKTKIVEAAEKYPQINANSNYYYDGDSNWQVTPFVEAGFYTDQTCYSQLPSPWHHASMEEWYYMFWARRVKDGYLERAETLLRLLINMMNINLAPEKS